MEIAAGTTIAPQQRARWINRRRNREIVWGIGCAAPAVLGFGVWQVGPMLASLVLSLTDWHAGTSFNWVGLGNYRTIFAPDPLFLKSLVVTLLFGIVSVPARIVFAYALALLLNQRLHGSAFFRTMFYLPSIMPLVASSVVWLWLFNPDFGLFNSILHYLHLPKLQWVYSSNTALLSLILMSLWDIGPMMVVFLAGLQGVPEHLYDAVEVDGGSGWNKFLVVTLPMTTPTILLNLVLSIIAAFQTFVQAYVITDGGPNNQTLFYGYYLYRTAFNQGEMGYACALGWVLFLIIAAISLIVFRSSSRWVYYEGGTQ